jgi:ADP-ribosylglycohydrolase
MASGAFNHQMWSDGVAMAISAAGIACAGRPEAAANLAEALGSVSNARDGVYAAQAVAAAISVGMVGASPDEMISTGLRFVPPDSWTARTLQRVLELNLPKMDLESALQAIEKHVIISWWPWADLVTEAVPAAMGVFLACQGDFVRAVPAGVRLGRDADTIGAIVGSLAGVYGGDNAIPDDWKQHVPASTGKCIGFVAGRVIADVADQLAERGALA